jgi:pantoate--beta-alanine ligase
MKIVNTIPEAQSYLKQVKKAGKTVGFVPTMGALHAGHISLLNRATIENDFVVCSIFVNPIQFNNKEDLIKYPRPIADDIRKLEEIECDLLFYPEAEEMYPEPVVDKWDFGNLDKVMEGKFRPGHFNGVAVVVRKLFEIIEPDRAYFGLKDYQQLRIVQAMTKISDLPVDIVPCPTAREKDGLAMSSRNVRLSAAERRIAPAIFKVLSEVKAQAGKMPVNDLEQWAAGQLNKYNEMDVEYLNIVDAETLMPVERWDDAKSLVVCTAVQLGKVRLIDNLIIF